MDASYMSEDEKWHWVVVVNNMFLLKKLHQKGYEIEHINYVPEDRYFPEDNSDFINDVYIAVAGEGNFQLDYGDDCTSIQIKCPDLKKIFNLKKKYGKKKIAFDYLFEPIKRLLGTIDVSEDWYFWSYSVMKISINKDKDGFDCEVCHESAVRTNNDTLHIIELLECVREAYLKMREAVIRSVPRDVTRSRSAFSKTQYIAG